MNRWRGKTAVVTGAASGIGLAITERLIEEGMNVAAFDIQYQRLRDREIEMRSRGESEGRGKLFPVKCDLTNERDILAGFEWVAENLGGVDVVVNNAGITHYSKVIESDTDVFRRMLDVNVLAVAICTRESVSSMRARNVEGHVFNINSILGHEIPEGVLHRGWNLYPSCKHATVAMSSIVRRELIDVKAKVRMTSVSPGLVKTEITSGTPELSNLFERIPTLEPADVADAVAYALGTRPEVQRTFFFHFIRFRRNKRGADAILISNSTFFFFFTRMISWKEKKKIKNRKE
ncbi:farnesol dehydrogenase isoform X1 [Neodiprion pinetum]|uniref:farnesol dehydrogenase isoform X1 n=1 Tax=Neodiprion pinetum TaxID=441929 RepID=UPI001EE050E9|nr:farnesol dehydrogenase-like isoform X1 [Neodiprion pinetum]